MLTDNTVVYQVVQNGCVMHHVDETGNYLYDTIPIGIGSWVIDGSPEVQPWMV